MVAPVSIQDAEFGSRRIAPLFPEIPGHLGQVVGVHRQALFFAERRIGLARHFAEAAQVFHGFNFSLFALLNYGEVLYPGFNGVDVVGCDALQSLLRSVGGEQQHAGALDADVGRRVDQVHTVFRRRGALVKLAGQILHRQILAARGAVVAHYIGNRFAEHRIAALLKELLGEAEKVVHLDKP